MLSDSATRRKWLSAVAAAGGTTMLAGCGSDGPQAQRQGTPPEETQATFVTAEYKPPDQVNYNPHDPLYFPAESAWLVFGQLFHISQQNGQFLPALATDWSRNGTTVTVNLDDRFTWHDGDPVTADDVVAQFTLDILAGSDAWEQAFVDVRAPDKHTVKIDVKQGTNGNVLQSFVAGAVIGSKPDTYQKFLPDDGSRGKEAVKWYNNLNNFQHRALKGQLESFTVDAPMGSNPGGNRHELIGWGPWKLAEKGQQRIVFELYEDHPFADRINFPRVQYDAYTTTQARFQSLLAGHFAAEDLNVTKSVWQQVPDKYSTEYRVNSWSGGGLAFNYESFPDPRIRQALAYALDKEAIVKNQGYNKTVDVHTDDSGYYGTDQHKKQFFGDGFISNNLTQYGTNRQKAASLLRSAGWRKQGGTWHDKNGTPVQIDIRMPSAWQAWVNAGHTVSEQLSDFGFKTTFSTKELVVYYTKTMIQTNYDISAWWTGGDGWQFPWHSYDVIWNALDTIGDKHNHPKEYKNVPMPVGNPNGSTQTVNWANLLQDIATTRIYDQNGNVRPQARQKYRKLAWTYNQMLPVYCLNELATVLFVDTQNWKAPNPDDPKMNATRNIDYAMHRGLIQSWG